MTSNRDSGPESRDEQAVSRWNRRDVMTAGGALAALSAIAPSIGTAQAASLARQPLHMAVVDTRFAPARTFAAQMKRSGLRVAPINGDITELWYDELDGLWRRQPAAIAGFTADSALFCLERLAMDRGLRVAFQRELTKPLVHWVIAPKEAVP